MSSYRTWAPDELIAYSPATGSALRAWTNGSKPSPIRFAPIRRRPLTLQIVNRTAPLGTIASCCPSRPYADPAHGAGGPCGIPVQRPAANDAATCAPRFTGLLNVPLVDPRHPELSSAADTHTAPSE